MVLGLAGCFAPTTPAGAPCDPASPACPSGQTCIASLDGHVCSAHDAGVFDTAQVPDDARDPDPILDAPPNTVSKTYTASIAECVAPMIPSPALCRSLNGNTQLVIDIRDAQTNDPWHAYLRFDIDNALAGKTITKVILRAVATAASNAPGPDSGSVFAVQPFTMNTLQQAVPARVGGQLAGNQGAVSIGEVVSWTLPPSTVTPGSPVYLGLYANDDDGVNYFNTDGPTPPRLIIDAQ
jgi:hypothetical protein